MCEAPGPDGATPVKTERNWAVDSDRHFSKEDPQMVTRRVQRRSASPGNARQQHVRCHLPPVRRLFQTDRQEVTGTGQDTGKAEPFCTAGGNAGWCRRSGDQDGGSSEY